MKIPLPKLKAMLLFFGKYTNSRLLGKTKLMKLFYFVDFGHLKKYGTPITYDTYIHLEHGPIPSAIKNLVDTATDDVDNSALAGTISIGTSNGSYLQRIIPARDFNESDKRYFSETELEIMHDVCDRFKEKNTREIEDAAHNESPWKKRSLLEKIDYELAINDSDCLVEKEEIELMSRIAGN